VDEASYNSWRGALADWLDESRAEPMVSSSAHPVARPVLQVLVQARQTVAGINATAAAGVKILDLNKYDHTGSILDTVLGLDSFSLAEYTYNLPGDRHPGIRLWYESKNSAPRISAIMFEDVQQWRLDADGRKISWQALHLDMADGRLDLKIPEGAERYVRSGQGWPSALTDALCLPIRLFR
jgi:hypothetical protein